jgi:hypothetical protein
MTYKYKTIELSEDYNEELLKNFHKLCENIFSKELMDPIEVWYDGLENNKNKNALQVSEFIILLDENNNEMIGGTFFEYYKISNSCLFSYFVINEKYREKGFGKKLIELSYQKCLVFSKKYENFFKNEELNEKFQSLIKDYELTETTDFLFFAGISLYKKKKQKN